jgi:hypothetical protein
MNVYLHACIEISTGGTYEYTYMYLYIYLCIFIYVYVCEFIRRILRNIFICFTLPLFEVYTN